jgi:putative redox protein
VYKVEVQWNGMMAFTGVSERSGNQVRLDTSVENGGENSGVTPMEAVLIGLAGCSGMDVVSILAKKRVEIDGLTIAVEGTRRSEHPKIFTGINVTYTFSGADLEAKRKALEDSVQLSMEKYCSVAGMLNKAAELTWQVELARS